MSLVDNNYKSWERAIILMDLNAFFASIEQLDFPELRKKPVAVTNGHEGSTIITCSYEARAYGIKTGMRLFEARKLCPDIIQRPGRPQRYAQVSSSIMAALINITPDVEIFSVDEAFLDITNCQRLHGPPINIAKMVKQVVYDTSSLYCSVGVGGDKTTAKYAAKLQKPNGLTLIHPSRSRDILARVPVTDLCGIADGIGGFLAKHGVILCGDMKKIPKSVLRNRYGPLGVKVWLMAQGLDPDPVVPTSSQEDLLPKSVGHGKVIPPNTTDRKLILNYFRKMSEKVAARLRSYELEAKKYYIAIKLQDVKISDKLSLEYYSNTGTEIYKLCESLLDRYWSGQGVFQVQVTALNPSPVRQQPDLFNSIDNKNSLINKVIDTVNKKFGNSAIQPASLIQHNSTPDVIAPAWRPNGIRNSIDKSN